MGSPDSLPTEVPVPHPPPGPTYVSVAPVELSFRLFVVSTIFALFVAVTLALRVASRFYAAIRLGWDDLCVFGAALFSFGQMALFGLLVFGGLGHHAETVPAPNQFSIPKVLFSFEILHIVSLNLGKLSAMFFYLTLFNNVSVQRVTKWCISAVALGTVGLILWQFLFCHPLSKMWEWDGLEKCGDRQPLYLAVCIWSIFTDLLVLVVPLPIIWKLNMKRTRKVRLSWLFAAGLIVTATSTVRLGYIATIDYHHDFSFRSAVPTFLAAIEPPETIICVSLPMVYSLFARLRVSMRGKGCSTPRLGRGSTQTQRSSLGHGMSSHKRGFTQFHNSSPDPFELAEMQRSQQMVLVSADRPAKTHRPFHSRSKSLNREAESSSGSETALVETPQTGTEPQNGGIMVSKDFTVSVSMSPHHDR
ncbi:hypothetical protein F5Y17DRAFT_471648 [Xylariaceae sp. FL0594]|nr:hypothetical protein F5Y17DRAFT_471648 [Xylariaceae sp. FL0594]